MIKIEKIPLNIIPSSDRSLLRPFFIGTQLPSNFYEPDSPRTLRLLSRILSLEETEVKTELNIIIKRLYLQNKDYLLSVFEQRYNQLEHLLPSDRNLSKDRKYLIGAFFSSRYLFESVSLCNPSIVKAPEQNENEKLKFILSLRAIGEGHISSISFREGVISNNGEITLYPVSTFATEPNLIPTHTYQKELFKRKLGELGLLDTFNNCFSLDFLYFSSVFLI